jgi:type I restriction enzyme S subunit
VSIISKEDRVLQWIGGLPNRWETAALGTRLKENKSSNKGMVEKQVLSLSYGRVVIKPEEKLRGLVPESFETYQILEPGDIVIRPTDLQNDQTSLRIGQSYFRGIITSAYIAVRPQNGMNYRYAAYMLAAYDFMKVFYGFGSGLRQNLDFKHIKHIPIPVPAADEQELIVRYLDHTEMRIAKAIAAKRSLVLLLIERRATMVQDLALGRLESSINSYDPEVAWIGRVPTTWQVVPSKSLFALRRERATPGTTIMTASQSRGIVPREEFMALEGRRVMAVLTGEDILKQVEPDDFVISMRSFQGGIEWSHVSGAVSSAYVVMAPRAGVVPEYYSHLLKSRAYISALRATSDLVRDGQALRYANFGKVPLPLPPVEDQERLARRISSSVADIDKAVVAVEAEIALLKEYRMRLISDVVTGKLDVRAEAASLPDVNPLELAAVLAGGTASTDEEEGTDGDD